MISHQSVSTCLNFFYKTFQAVNRLLILLISYSLSEASDQFQFFDSVLWKLSGPFAVALRTDPGEQLEVIVGKTDRAGINVSMFLNVAPAVLVTLPPFTCAASVEFVYDDVTRIDCSEFFLRQVHESCVGTEPYVLRPVPVCSRGQVVQLRFKDISGRRKPEDGLVRILSYIYNL